MIQIYDGNQFPERYIQNLVLIKPIERVESISSIQLKKGKAFSRQDKKKENQRDFKEVIKERLK
jgi:hypothetical protein